MGFPTIAAVALAAISHAGLAGADRPNSTSICDYYTTALLKDNTDVNQLKVLTLLVNTVVIGNFSSINTGVSVPGILAPGTTADGTAVNLLPYFNGALASSNHHGVATSVNFLDGGGGDPLKKAMPANDNTSNQYFLLTHLYSFFGSLLGCSHVGSGGFPGYTSVPSMYQVHKFMDLNDVQVRYFIQQVGLSALSFGVTHADAASVGDALHKLFGHRCSAAVELVPGKGPQLQSICIDATCAVDENNATCSAYDAVQVPQNSTGNSTMIMGNDTMTMSSPTASGAGATATNSMGMPMGTATPASRGAGFAAGLGVMALAVVGSLVTLFL